MTYRATIVRTKHKPRMRGQQVSERHSISAQGARLRRVHHGARARAGERGRLRPLIGRLRDARAGAVARKAPAVVRAHERAVRRLNAPLCTPRAPHHVMSRPHCIRFSGRKAHQHLCNAHAKAHEQLSCSRPCVCLHRACAAGAPHNPPEPCGAAGPAARRTAAPGGAGTGRPWRARRRRRRARAPGGGPAAARRSGARGPGPPQPRAGTWQGVSVVSASLPAMLAVTWASAGRLRRCVLTRRAALAYGASPATALRS